MECLFELTKLQSSRMKGIAILLVLFAHIGLVKNGTGGVALFLFSSGYGLFQSYAAKGMQGYFHKKIVSVYIPYAIVAAMQLFIFRITNIKTIIITMVGLSFGKNVDPTYWYISYLFFWYLVFGISGIINDRIKKKHQIYVSNVVLAVIIILSIPLLQMVIGKGAWTSGSGARFYVYMFPLGVLFGLAQRIYIMKRLKMVIWCMIFIVSVSYWLGNYGKVTSEIYTMFTISQAFLCISLSQLLDYHPFCKSLEFIGRYSYAIYLCEGYFLVKLYDWLDIITSMELKHLAFLAVSVLSGYILQNAVFSKLSLVVPNNTGLAM